MLLRQFLIKANVVFYDKGSIVDLTFYGGGTRPEIDGQLSSNKVVAGCVTTGDRYTHTVYSRRRGGG